jgi:hypothetical protein
MNKTITNNSCKTIINKLNKIIRSEIRATIRLLNGMFGHSGAIDTSFRNIEQLVPRHFDHTNSLIPFCHFNRRLHKSVLYILRNRLVRRSGTSNQDARTALCAYFNEVPVIGALLVAEGTRSRYFLNKG